MRRLVVPLLSLPLALSACRGDEPQVANPLSWGDAEWPEAPIPQPGGNGGDDDDSGGDDGASTGGGFTPSADLASVSSCDPFAQDCPEGEKCVPYASTGGALDSTKCVPVLGDQMVGELCLYDGVVQATDDCDAISMCWDTVENRGALEGTCAGFCQGTPDDPICDQGLECLIGAEGSLAICLEPEGGTDTDTDTDTGTDTGTDTDTGTESGMPIEGELEIEDPPVPMADEEAMCPNTTEPQVFYMSNDDSNSQASPAIARRAIHDGQLVDSSVIRIHEFLNYYDLAFDNPEDVPAKVGVQMRRTNAETGQFTLLLYAQGQLLREEDRPAMNLVFSLDTSGSMSGERIELVKDSMTALAGHLRAGDVVSLVTWSHEQSIHLAGHTVLGPDDPQLLAAIEGLEAGGSTDLSGGLTTAYQLAETHYAQGGINRVILMSDGGANTGVTDIETIAAAASDEDGEGIYMVGVGVGQAAGYRDDLMDAVTDAGKGAYIFVDSPSEAELQFGERFLSNVSVAARDVQMRLTMPWYFGVEAFHGEEYSSDPAEVEPQHLAPNDAMSFHQIIAACDPGYLSADDTVEAHVEYLHPLTLEPMSDTVQVALGEVVTQDATQLYKADAVVGFAKALIVIDDRMDNDEPMAALQVATSMKVWLANAATALADPEVQEMADLMGEYQTVLMAHL